MRSGDREVVGIFVITGRRVVGLVISDGGMDLLRDRSFGLLTSGRGRFPTFLSSGCVVGLAFVAA